ncbi:hypothetical protein V5799_003379 [Amblyomma americanum]|uniref:Uncharacterized protein n=1 Tax=Amblyomma americanum TaxID=6943 RepID=A0AAQ4D955_AMBAM
MIILQTHVSDSLVSEGPCVSFPISMASPNQNRQLPNFEIAKQAAASLRARGDKFRVLFSSTLGVMVYAGALHSAEPSSAHKACEKAYMVDSDFTCRGNVSHTKEIYDEKGMYAYYAYQSDGRPYFVTLETSKSLQDKILTGRFTLVRSLSRQNDASLIEQLIPVPLLLSHAALLYTRVIASRVTPKVKPMASFSETFRPSGNQSRETSWKLEPSVHQGVSRVVVLGNAPYAESTHRPHALNLSSGRRLTPPTGFFLRVPQGAFF